MQFESLSVLDHPYTCISMIESCRDYIFDGCSWNCRECNEGYILFDNYIGKPVCAQAIQIWAEYMSDGECWFVVGVSGFYLRENKIEFLPINCLLYDLEDVNIHAINVLQDIK